jgi:hypothetical protein
MRLTTCLVYLAMLLTTLCAVSTITFLVQYSQYLIDNDPETYLPQIFVNCSHVLTMLCILRVLIYSQSPSNNINVHMNMIGSMMLIIPLWIIFSLLAANHIYEDLGTPPLYTPLLWNVIVYRYIGIVLFGLMILAIIISAIVGLAIGAYVLFKNCHFEEIFCPAEYQDIPEKVDVVIDYNTIENIHTRAKEGVCYVCQQKYQKDDQIIVLKNCSHYFHEECLKSNKCPVCA